MFLRQNPNSPTPPPPLPPPTSSPAIDKTGPWVGRDENGLKALFRFKDQRKYCQAYIPIFFVFYFVCRMNSKLFEKTKTQ